MSAEKADRLRNEEMKGAEFAVSQQVTFTESFTLGSVDRTVPHFTGTNSASVTEPSLWNKGLVNKLFPRSL